MIEGFVFGCYDDVGMVEIGEEVGYFQCIYVFGYDWSGWVYVELFLMVEWFLCGIFGDYVGDFVIGGFVFYFVEVYCVDMNVGCVLKL